MNDDLTQRALKSIKVQFSDAISAGYSPPMVVRDHVSHYTTGPDAKIHEHVTAWAIVWEEGPYEWAYLAPEGGYDEEISSLLGRKFERSPAPNWPKEVWPEAVNGHTLGLFIRD